MSWLRRIVFALLAGAVVLIALEFVLRFVERYRPPASLDARSLLSAQQLVFPDQPVTRNKINGRDMLVKWCGEASWYGTVGQAVPAVKAKNEYRIVLLGGSAPAGYGAASTATFIKKAERLLNRNQEGRRVITINLARTAWNSAQMMETLRRCAPDLQPDLIVTVMGNNEYLDLNTFGVSLSDVRRKIFALWLDRHLALARFFRPAIRPGKGGDPPRWPSFARDPQVLAFVRERLMRSIHDMAVFARAHHARLLVCTVPVNQKFHGLREWFFTDNSDRPGQEYPREYLQARWGMVYGDYETAAALMEQRAAKLPDDPAPLIIAGLVYRRLGRPEAAERCFASALALLDRQRTAGNAVVFSEVVMEAIARCELHGPAACAQFVTPLTDDYRNNARGNPLTADMYHWQAGYLLSVLGRDAEAREEFRANIDEQPLPANRADAWINQTLTEAARREGDVDAFDLAAALADISPAGILGYEYFFDYCHYSALGHTAVGALLARRIAELMRLPVALPAAADAVAEERALRRARPTDLPDLEYWIGADYRPECLVSEHVCWAEFDVPIKELKRLQQEHDTALTEVFLGNWYAASPTWDQSGAEARKHYERALQLDPHFAPARANLEWLRRDRW
jgi:tetratricopeptide (TPR) repeat protein